MGLYVLKHYLHLSWLLKARYEIISQVFKNVKSLFCQSVWNKMKLGVKNETCHSFTHDRMNFSFAMRFSG